VVNVAVSEASLPDADLAAWLVQAAKRLAPRLTHVWADASYRGRPLAARLQHTSQVTLHVVWPAHRPGPFRVQGKRWLVERTFAWLGHARRLAKDYELYFKSSAAMVYVAMIRLLLRRLASSSS
jgi:transposase